LKSTLRNTFIIILVSITCFSCCSTKEITEIKPQIVYVPVIEDSIREVTITDTVIVGYDIIHSDTVTIVKYFPKLQKFYIKVKPDSIIIMDTTRIVEYSEKGQDNWSVLKYICLGFAIAFGIFLIYLWRK